MACLITSTIARGCRDNVGGIKKVYIANASNVVSITPAPGSTANDTITAIGMTGSGKFFEFQPTKMSSNWVENVQANTQNGTIAYEQVLTLMFAKNEAAKRNQIKLLGQADVMVIVQDYNDKYWLLGESNFMQLNGGTSNSGTALADMNGWNITLQAIEKDPAREIGMTAGQIAAIVTAV